MDAMVCCGECLEGEILVSSKTSSNLLSVCWFSLWCLLGFEAMASTNSCVAFLKMLFFKAQACMVEQLFFRQIFTYTQVKWNKRVQQQNKLLLVNCSRTLELWSAVSRQTRNKIGILSTTHILQQRANIFTLMWWFLLTWKLKNGSNGRWHFWQLQKRMEEYNFQENWFCNETNLLFEMKITKPNIFIYAIRIPVQSLIF